MKFNEINLGITQGILDLYSETGSINIPVNTEDNFFIGMVYNANHLALFRVRAISDIPMNLKYEVTDSGNEGMSPQILASLKQQIGERLPTFFKIMEAQLRINSIQ